MAVAGERKSSREAEADRSELIITRYYERLLDTPAAASVMSQIVTAVFSGSAFASALVAGAAGVGLSSWRFLVPFILAIGSATLIARALMVPAQSAADEAGVDNSRQQLPEVRAEQITAGARRDGVEIVKRGKQAIALAIASQAVLALGLAFPARRDADQRLLTVYVRQGSVVAQLAPAVCRREVRSGIVALDLRAARRTSEQISGECRPPKSRRKGDRVTMPAKVVLLTIEP